VRVAWGRMRRDHESTRDEEDDGRGFESSRQSAQTMLACRAKIAAQARLAQWVRPRAMSCLGLIKTLGHGLYDCAVTPTANITLYAILLHRLTCLLRPS
jgi:hypothetical protein